ncbi:MAG: hypothetical protein LBH26_08155 [Treponema sp.]|jgi:hypothetical protein|nr:hypothetical protein [Treponema sp.]
MRRATTRIRLITLLVLLVFLSFPGTAQNAGELDAVLDSPALSWGQAARLVLIAAGREDLPEAEAFAALQNMAKLPGNAAVDRAVKLGGLSLIIMKSFNLNGGLYRLFPSAHYACRELVYLGIIQGRSDPGMKVPGERFLRILGRALDYTGLDREEG